MPVWNLWHGCRKISPGCQNCYVYRRDAEFGKDSSEIRKTAAFLQPLKRDRKGAYKLKREDGEVYTCMTSDFFLEEADAWRPEAWKVIKERSDLSFSIITKRIHRFMECIPPDWGKGYENVTIICTCEDQKRADDRLPVFMRVPAKHKKIIHEPLLGPIREEIYLRSGQIEQVICGGESGESARICDYTWILELRSQCIDAAVPFCFKQTGTRFLKDGKLFYIACK